VNNIIAAAKAIGMMAKMIMDLRIEASVIERALFIWDI
jgi:hypothetical protein